MKCARLLVAAALSFVVTSGYANAQTNYPAKTITLIVNYGAGGGSDAIARALASALEKPLGQKVVVENVSGGMATRGVTAVVTAPADGYVIGIATNSPLGFAVHSVQGLPWGSPDSYEVIGAVGSIANVLATQPGAPFSNIKELVDFAKKNPGKLRIANVAGGLNQYVWEQFKNAADIDVRLVPYSGDSDATAAFLGGNTELYGLTWPGIKGHVDAGKVKPLALFARERVESHPELPTFKDLGYDVTTTSDYLLYAPKGIPADVTKKLAAALKDALADPGFVKTAKARDVQVRFRDGDEVKKQLREIYNSGATSKKDS